MSTKFDIVEIKEKLPPISELLTRDGHTIRRSGSAIFVCCPFHDEKTPSCRVDDDAGRFHCFGCGVHGDSIDYWQRSRGLSIQDTLSQLASVAGVLPGEYTAAPRPRPAPARVEAELEPMTGERLDRWEAACQRLATSPGEIQRIAEWRGIDPDVITWAASQGLIGTYLWWDMPREAFLVEAPDGAGGRFPVSVHIRLAPHSKGNHRDKQSWNFDPKGCGAWPFIVGKPATAQYIFLTEGQWDALALISIMGWHRRDWPRVAVVGLRGATSGAKFLQHSIHPRATVFAIADADQAGEGWFDEKGLLAQLHEKVRAVHAFWPTTEKCDLNDLVKSGELDRETMLSYLTPLMPNPRLKTTGITFTAWCKAKQGEPGHIGRAARFVTQDKTKPKRRVPLKVWDRHWRKAQVPEDLYTDLCLTFADYQKHLKTPSPHESEDILIAP